MSAREVVREYWIVVKPGVKTSKEGREYLWKGDSYFDAVKRIAECNAFALRPRKVTVYRKVKPARVPVGYVNVYDGMCSQYTSGPIYGSVEDARTAARPAGAVVMALHHVD